MNQDWSNEWLQQVAGWKAVKAGLSLVDRGLVKEAEFQEGNCRGAVGSSKVFRVRVIRSDARKVETFCPCSENQRTGAMCDHAVAIIVAARDRKPTAAIAEKTSAPILPLKSTTEKADVLAYHIELFPRWQEEWKNGRLTVKINLSARDPIEADVALHRWLVKQRISAKTGPWVLPLSGPLLEEFLHLAMDYSELQVGEQTIVLNDGLDLLPVESSRNGDMVTLRMTEAGLFLGARKGEFLVKSGKIYRVADPIEAQLLFTVFSGKSYQLTVDQLINSESLLAILSPQSDADWLNQLQWRSLAPAWHLDLDGTIDALHLRISGQFDVGGQIIKRPLQTLEGFRQESNNVVYTVDQHSIRRQLELLHQQGWKHKGDFWTMNDEEALLRFFQDGCAELRRESAVWIESERLQRVLSNLVVLRSHLEVQAHSSRELSVQFEFQSAEGKKFDPEKIRHLLQSGKRLIQTNDGKSLILPKESWEIFLHTAHELQFAQQKGRFLAKNSHKIIIDHLRKYYDKTLIDNVSEDFHEADFAKQYPLVKATLRPYQGQGVIWLQQRLNDMGFALLADEMGLGKTVQTIALISNCASLGHPALIVVPTSLLQNWVAEIQKFAPSLKTIVLHGDKRDDQYAQFDHCHAIVTSYGILVNDRAPLMKREYSLMVLDEASMIRNPDTDAARACFRIQAKKKLALTGTPLENSLRDLWSIFQFLQPGYLGTREHFRDLYEKPNESSETARESLRLRVSPFLLRRTKDQVAKDLPEKVEIDSWCELSPQQKSLYQRVLDEGLVQIDQLFQKEDRSAHMKVLTLLLRLRQICCDAALFSPDLYDQWSMEQRSAKTERLMQIVEGTLTSGRKMLVFSQFAKQLHLIEAELKARSIPTLRLDGATQNRQQMVDQFQSAGGPPIFLISLKAGGYGLNLTAASTVVHFDPWWNPAAERQASDRAHRIGQTQAVNIYQLLTRGTVEDRVKKLQREKAALADSLFGNAPAGKTSKMPSIEEIHQLLAL